MIVFLHDHAHVKPRCQGLKTPTLFVTEVEEKEKTQEQR